MRILKLNSVKVNFLISAYSRVALKTKNKNHFRFSMKTVNAKKCEHSYTSNVPCRSHFLTVSWSVLKAFALPKTLIQTLLEPGIGRLIDQIIEKIKIDFIQSYI
jgi:hypothetical protein